MRKAEGITKPPRKQRAHLRLVNPPPPEPGGPTDQPALSLAQWAPLDEAFTRIKTALHSNALAEHDIVKDMLGGRLASAMRRLSRDGADVFERLPADFWRGHTVEEQAEIDRTGAPTGGWVARVPTAPLRFGGSRVWFFVLRRDLDRLYPVSGREEPAADTRRQAPLTGHKPGPPPAHDWPTVVAGEAIRRAAAGEKFPSIASMIKHCEKVLPGGYSPGRKEMQILLQKLRRLSGL